MDIEIDFQSFVEEHRRRITEAFRVDMNLLGDPFGEPAYMTAECVRRKALENLCEMEERFNVKEEEGSETED